MTEVAIVLSCVLGLAVGSFLNVVVWRVPRGESVVRPASHCPRCGHMVRSRDNIPVVSWLLLRGRCRDCGEPISPRYPAVELGTAIAFGLVAWWIGWSVLLPAYLYLAAISVCLSLIDLDVRRLPDAIVLPSWIIAPALLGLAAAAEGDGAAMLRALAGAAAVGLFFLVAAIAYPAGMGLGDVKLSPVLGLYLGYVGWGAVVVGMFGAFLLGAIVGVAVLVVTRDRKAGIPFGPWMIVGTWIGLVVGQSLFESYLSLLG